MQSESDIRKIEQLVFTPALKLAMEQAETLKFKRSDSLLAATNAHLNMLVGLVGIEEARKMLQKQADFLTRQSNDN